MSAPSVAMVIDAAPAAGLGHVARSRAIAHALRERGASVTALLDHPIPSTVAAWQTSFDRVVVTDDRAAAEELGGAGVVVVDSYTLELGAFGAAAGLAVLDDGPPRPIDADLIVNPNLGASTHGYRPRPGGQVLAGSAYALVAPEITAVPAPEHHDAARRVLVTCGAADPAGMTARYLDALARVPDAEVRVVLGPFDARADELAARALAAGHSVVRDASGLAEHARWATLALTTLGTTAVELACLGVPNLSVAVDRRQLPHLEVYAGLGVVVSLGWHADASVDGIARAVTDLLADDTRRADARRAARAAVDGMGAGRVADALVRMLEVAG